MPLHALDDIGDAIDATKSLLVPVDKRQWLRLAFVVVFIGGGGGGGVNQLQNANSFNQQDPQFGGSEFELSAPLDAVLLQPTGPGAELPPGGQELLAGAGLTLLAGIALFVLIVAVLGLLSNFMEFVFVQSLIEREVHVRKYFGANIGNGLRLLLFRLVVSFLSLLATVGVLFAVFVTVFGGNVANIDITTVFSLLPWLIAPLFLVSAVFGLVTGLTNNFVVPLMLEGDHGIVAGWRRLGASLSAHPKQYVVYVVFSVILGIGTGLVSGVVLAAVGVVLLIPFGLLAAVCWLALGNTIVTLVSVGIVLAPYVFIVFAIAMFIKVPLQSFLRYYAMLVLGDIDESMDPIPAVRREIRAS